MKLLFDEPVPRPFRAGFPRNFDISTVQEMNGSGIGNGELLRRLPAGAISNSASFPLPLGDGQGEGAGAG